MIQKAMEPFGNALWAYLNGQKNIELIFRRDDGVEGRVPASHFFREPEIFSDIEKAAIAHCRGKILDAGGGTGIHSLVLQQKGMQVTAIDISPTVVKIMKKRGVADARCADIFYFQGGPFDTILLMGHGIGMVETLSGFDRFLIHASGLLSDQGQILFDSLDVRTSSDPANLAYHEANRQAGRYVGEVRMQIEYEGDRGPYCGWLHIDAETFKEKSRLAGWKTEILCKGENGDYLARLFH